MVRIMKYIYTHTSILIQIHDRCDRIPLLSSLLFSCGVGNVIDMSLSYHVCYVMYVMYVM